MHTFAYWRQRTALESQFFSHHLVEPRKWTLVIRPVWKCFYLLVFACWGIFLVFLISFQRLVKKKKIGWCFKTFLTHWTTLKLLFLQLFYLDPVEASCLTIQHQLTSPLISVSFQCPLDAWKIQKQRLFLRTGWCYSGL